ncbi:hypothetical protein QWA68_016967, partial [Fusarium oxysporum]
MRHVNLMNMVDLGHRPSDDSLSISSLPPNTQSELFSNQPQWRRWQPTRHKEGARDAGLSVDAEHGNSGGSICFSDRQSLRALRANLTIAIGKMDKYIATLEDSPSYWAAMTLHPGLQKRWIEKHLPEEQAQRIIHGFKKFFDEEYSKQGPLVIQQASHSRSSYLVDEDFYDKPEDIAPKDELTEYLSLPLLLVDGPLEWWRLHQDSLPKLARMAFDLLSIPATS